MTNNFDLTIKKPVAFWNRELSISPKEFFCSLGKAAISGAVFDGKGVAENLLETIIKVAPQDKPAYAAWFLIYKSLQQALVELIKEYEEFFTDANIELNQERLAEELETALNAIETGFDASFFDRPNKLPLLDDIQPSLIQWLTSLDMSEAEATALHLRLKQRFVLTLHQQWLASPNEYACIEEALKSPFVTATKTERAWMQYSAWLQEQPNERLFAEAFSLRQVFVPLRAYYLEKQKQAKEEFIEIGRQSEAEAKRIVVDLHDELETWVRNFNPDNAVRVISGGPGSGKSSFAKMFAAYVASEIKEVPLIFVSMHHFDLSDNLISAVEQFVKEDLFYPAVRWMRPTASSAC